MKWWRWWWWLLCCENIYMLAGQESNALMFQCWMLHMFQRYFLSLTHRLSVLCKDFMWKYFSETFLVVLSSDTDHILSRSSSCAIDIKQKWFLFQEIRIYCGNLNQVYMDSREQWQRPRRVGGFEVKFMKVLVAFENEYFLCVIQRYIEKPFVHVERRKQSQNEIIYRWKGWKHTQMRYLWEKNKKYKFLLSVSERFNIREENISSWKKKQNIVKSGIAHRKIRSWVEVLCMVFLFAQITSKWLERFCKNARQEEEIRER